MGGGSWKGNELCWGAGWEFLQINPWCGMESNGMRYMKSAIVPDVEG